MLLNREQIDFRRKHREERQIARLQLREACLKSSFKPGREGVAAQ
jgi:hypothetical protein